MNNMKNSIYSLLLTLFSLLLLPFNVNALQQKYEDFSWTSPNGWEGAVFDVPTWFAQDMNYSGREVIRFHDGFYDKGSNGFWTYAFALLVEQTETPTTQDLIDETRRYFLGLARGLGDMQKKNYPVNKIVVSAKSGWVAAEQGSRRSQVFQLDAYDSFTTAAPIKLNVRISTWLCSNRQRAIHYSISPHDLSHPLWKQLDEEVKALKCW
jgi:hypothetical protein